MFLISILSQVLTDNTQQQGSWFFIFFIFGNKSQQQIFMAWSVLVLSHPLCLQMSGAPVRRELQAAMISDAQPNPAASFLWKPTPHCGCVCVSACRAKLGSQWTGSKQSGVSWADWPCIRVNGCKSVRNLHTEQKVKPSTTVFLLFRQLVCNRNQQLWLQI